MTNSSGLFSTFVLLAPLVLGSGCDNTPAVNTPAVNGVGKGSTPSVDPSARVAAAEPQLTVEDAKRAFNQGDVVSAEKIARKILVGEPTNLDAGLVLVGLAVRRSDPIAAAELMLQLAESQPGQRDLLQAQAAGLFDQGGDWERAIKILADVVQRAPERLDVRRELAALLNSRGLRFDANEHLRYLAGRMTLTPRELIALVNPLLTWNSFSTKPDIGDADFVAQSGTLNVVAALRANGDVRDALTLLDRSELLRNGHPAAVAMHGWLLSLNQDFDALATWAANANDDCRRYPAYWLGLGNLMLHLQRPSAVHCFTQALRREPSAKEALAGLSQSLTTNNRPDLAGDVTERQKAINESQALAYKIGSGNVADPRLGSEIGRVLNSIGRPIESLAWQEAMYAAISPSAPQLTILRQHKSKVLEQLPGGQDDTLIVCGIAPDQFASVENDLVMLRARASKSGNDDPSDAIAINLPPSPPVFVDIAKSVGIEMRHFNAVNPIDKEFRLFEALGSGVAVMDFDRDGNVDLYLGQAGSDPPLGVSKHSNQLMRGAGDRFVDVSFASGGQDFGYTHGVSAGDWNQDGFCDLVIGNVGVNRLLINQGDGTFRSASPESGELSIEFDQPTVTTSLAIADVTGDSLPDLFEVNYVDDPRVFDPIQYDANGKPLVLPGPKHFNAAAARLFATSADGRLVPQVIGPPETVASTGLGLLITDFDGDGQNEIFVANDQNPNHLWKLQPPESDTKWVDVAVVLGCAFGTGGKPLACMGIAVADFDHNGRLDLHVTNFNGECSNLYLQNDSGLFVDRAIAYQMDKPTVAMVGFGTQAFDYDNNASIDLVIGNGHIEDFQAKGKPFRMPTQILANLGNQFAPMDVLGDSEYWSAKHLGRGVAMLDWNHDGRIDIAATDLVDNFVLLENRTESEGHYLQIELVGIDSERDAIGATVTVACGERKFVAAVQTGDGYLCRNETLLHYGLGDSRSIDQVTVHWPSGATSDLKGIAVDQRILLIENQQENWKR